MARIVAVPDVHGSHAWEVVKTYPKESYDYIVFLGDYFDTWKNQWPDQGENFLAICDFVRQDTEHRKMLIGNHDWSYLTMSIDGSLVSGHQSARSSKIRELLEQNLDIIDLAFEYDGWVFSHAGFSKTWVNYIKGFFHQLYDDWPEDKFTLSFLNTQWHKINHSDEDNKWIAFDELLDWHGISDGGGDEITQGPLWIRPGSLLQDAYYRKQIVGHTETVFSELLFLQKNDNKVVLVDSPEHEVLGIIDTEKEYAFLTPEELAKRRNLL